MCSGGTLYRIKNMGIIINMNMEFFEDQGCLEKLAKSGNKKEKLIFMTQWQPPELLSAI